MCHATLNIHKSANRIFFQLIACHCEKPQKIYPKRQIIDVFMLMFWLYLDHQNYSRKR